MKILYLSPDPGINADEDCGAGSHIQETIRALRGLGHGVRLLGPDFRYGGPACAGPDARVPRHLWFSRIIRSADAARNFFRSSGAQSASPINPPDPDRSREENRSGAIASRPRRSVSAFFHGPFRHHLHLAEERSVYGDRFFRAAKALIRSWQPDGVIERYALGHHAVTNWCRKNRIPHVLEVNALLAGEAGRSERARTAERRFLASAPFVLTVSEALRGEIRDHDILVNPNGVDIDRFRPPSEDEPDRTGSGEELRTRYGLKTGPLIGWIGGFGPNRGLEQSLDIAVAACARRPDLQFMIMGDGPLMDQARRTVEKSGAAHAVRLTGRIPKDRVPAHLSLLDMALAPYPAGGAAYFSPLKIFEYMAMGLPTLATDAGQSRTLLADGAGCLLPPGKTGEWAEAVIALADDPVRRREMGGRARARVARDYTWEANARRILEGIAMAWKRIRDAR